MWQVCTCVCVCVLTQLSFDAQLHNQVQESFLVESLRNIAAVADTLSKRIQKQTNEPVTLLWPLSHMLVVLPRKYIAPGWICYLQWWENLEKRMTLSVISNSLKRSNNVYRKALLIYSRIVYCIMSYNVNVGNFTTSHFFWLSSCRWQWSSMHRHSSGASSDWGGQRCPLLGPGRWARARWTASD